MCKYCNSTDTRVELMDGKRWKKKLVCAGCNRWIKFIKDVEEKTPQQLQEERDKRNKTARENAARKKERDLQEYKKKAEYLLIRDFGNIWNGYSDSAKEGLILTCAADMRKQDIEKRKASNIGHTINA